MTQTCAHAQLRDSLPASSLASLPSATSQSTPGPTADSRAPTPSEHHIPIPDFRLSPTPSDRNPHTDATTPCVSPSIYAAPDNAPASPRPPKRLRVDTTGRAIPAAAARRTPPRIGIALPLSTCADVVGPTLM
ncbi:hypothetical protein B0H11DRAFT_2217218 [Mycena galericulata]|nr:hypothetical protein B0H11DRAFT_2217218 [Mycena galericulata]